jgi:hypothetical protein
MPIFAPAEREAEDVDDEGDGLAVVVVGEGVEDVAGIVVELKELEVDVPTIPMAVSEITPPPVVQLQAGG